MTRCAIKSRLQSEGHDDRDRGVIYVVRHYIECMCYGIKLGPRACCSTIAVCGERLPNVDMSKTRLIYHLAHPNAEHAGCWRDDPMIPF